MGELKRGLSARQVQMIAVAGTIGTGLFLGTGRSLAQGGPASLVICYAIIGFVVYITLLLLGEMATQYPISGSFNAYATRFVDDSYGFALSWNYWFNDAVSVASDLTAAQIVLAYWFDGYLWIVSLAFLLFLLGVNAFSVGAYGELEYWIASVKVITIVAFIITGTFVNLGFNTSHRVIGFENWSIPGAPFVGGFAGFAKVFVTASFAYGGTESLGITAGETKDPTKNMPRVVKFVFFRITTSPFTIVFTMAGSKFAATLMNTTILTSVLSAGNHALFAGTRVLHNMSLRPHSHAPSFLQWTNKRGVPVFALLATAAVSGVVGLTKYVGRGELWGWLLNLVGVSNQIAWVSIGLASYRFRKAWIMQGRKRSDMKFRGAEWTWGWGPPFVVITVSLIILIQGYSSFIPTFNIPSFISLYLQLPSMLILFAVWKIVHRIEMPNLENVDLSVGEWSDDGDGDESSVVAEAADENESRGVGVNTKVQRWWWKVWEFVA
ncbi:amino acid permease/ SLC12A domain-containing protein [Hysterangium stoloniferum]|nr:amino acid permease/ SLC12A domain-containing protein [Hysterangium stoloniferum]